MPWAFSRSAATTQLAIGRHSPSQLSVAKQQRQGWVSRDHEQPWARRVSLGRLPLGTSKGLGSASRAACGPLHRPVFIDLWQLSSFIRLHQSRHAITHKPPQAPEAGLLHPSLTRCTPPPTPSAPFSPLEGLCSLVGMARGNFRLVPSRSQTWTARKAYTEPSGNCPQE